MLTTSLRFFLSVAEHGSIRLASERLNISQSAISRRIQALEYEVGAVLFERSARGVVLTAHGKLLVATAQQIGAAASDLSKEIESLRRVETGHVRVAAIESVLPDLLPNVLDRYLESHPKITFDITIATSSAVVSLVRNGEVDIGVTFSAGKQADTKSLFKSREPLLAVFRSDHSLASKAIVSVTDVMQFPTAMPAPGSAMRTIYDEVCRKAGFEPKPAMETNSLELLHNFAISGLGIAILLRHTVQTSIETGILKARRFQETSLQGSLEIIALKGRPMPPATQLFNSVLQDAITSRPTPE
ncbi:LysR family transcriptional regulator [Burkholderia sp. L27(2015)]|uniref:LysR family transcriptional regulator n=1 Tax=Burkholderia sp. L27(2015) TaxID=1641858 RepID=UPI00131E01FC|nr:LysR family transcriptional regulator [Burkholderia sp. L27(2015)]